VIIKVNGVGKGKDTAIRSFDTVGLDIIELIDATGIPHNGCKPPKKPR
jgi:small subunit ribosomal protein S11